jgi:predicted ribosome-associated RNA-binding protein Tma20
MPGKNKSQSNYGKNGKNRNHRSMKPSKATTKKERRKKQLQKSAAKSLATKVSPSKKSAPTLPVIVHEVKPYLPATVPVVQDNIVDDNNMISQQEHSVSAAAAVHNMNPSASSVSVNNNSQETVSQAAQITAPVVSVFGGIALIAAAMFYVVRKRKRNSMMVAAAQHDEDDENKLQDISLSSDSEDDEAIAMKKNQPPRLTPTNTRNKDTTTTMNQQPELHYYQKQYIHHHNYYQQQRNTEEMLQNHAAISIDNKETEQDQSITSSTDYQSSETLVGSQTATRTNSSVSTATTKRSTPLAALSPKLSLHIQRPQSTASSWRSSGSSIYTDALVSPTSTMVSPRVSTFIMVAERQQLQHERPNVLDHYGEIKSSRSTPIETYKAQLSPIINPNEEDGDNGEDYYSSGDIPLPFFDVIDIPQEMFI